MKSIVMIFRLADIIQEGGLLLIQPVFDIPRGRRQSIAPPSKMKPKGRGGFTIPKLPPLPVPPELTGSQMELLGGKEPSWQVSGI